jgi:uncharacterized membrane protein (UPF0127 family)
MLYLLFAFSLWWAAAAAADPLVTFPLRVKSHEIRAEVASTEAQRLRGLMYRQILAHNTGMIFVYPRSGIMSMWMKNTPVPLSVAFIDEKGRILNIEDMAPYSEQAHSSSGAAAYALEMNRGWFARKGIKPGDRVRGLEKLPRPE